jgi:hypothetical protein
MVVMRTSVEHTLTSVLAFHFFHPNVSEMIDQRMDAEKGGVGMFSFGIAIGGF